MSAMTTLSDFPAAPLWRRIAAAIYDYLLVAAIWFVTTGVILLVMSHYHWGLSNYHGVGRPSDAFLHGVLLPLLIVEAWAFYAWFWLHGGQTLGMRSWRIRVVDYRGRKLALWQTLARFLGAWLSLGLAGAGYWLVLLKPNQSLHDRLSASVTLLAPKHHR